MTAIQIRCLQCGTEDVVRSYAMLASVDAG